jgi:hypothetical protein
MTSATAVPSAFDYFITSIIEGYIAALKEFSCIDSSILMESEVSRL